MNNTFKLAIIGSGRWGMNHIRTASRLFGESLKTVCDVDPDRAAKVRDAAPKAAFVNDPRRILEDPEITAVIISTPAETHFTLAKSVLESGKHALVEKPMALFSRQAKELDELAQKNNRVLMVGHLLLFHPAIRKIKELINDGTLGKLQYIYSNRLNLGTVRKEENILWSFAPHDISVLQYFIGDDPVAVDAKGGVFLQPGIHDVTLTTLTYPNNIQAHIHVSWLHPFKEHRLVVIGDRSMVVFEDSRQSDKLVLYPKGIDWVNGEPVKRDEDFQVIDYEAPMPLDLEQLHFRDCIVNGEQPLTDGKNAVSVLEILEKAQNGLEKHGAPATAKQTEAAKPAEKLPYFVHDTAMVDKGCEIGEGTKIWHYSHVQSGSKLGKKCVLGQNVNVGNNVTIGNFVKIQNNVSVYEGVELEDYVFCGPSMVFTNVLNPRCEFPQRGSEFYHKTVVKYGASIGANATIVCGTTLGKFAFIGAGAVVTKDVPEYALMVGNPARQIGWMCRCGTRLNLIHDHAKCSNCNREYKEASGKITNMTDKD
ncbi:MAG: Gfo/Idh/MocA family oxidoreductase [Calditrichia bacterium]